MEIKFSRHAKRRAKLYKIPEFIVKDIISELDLGQGEHTIIRKVDGFVYPLKIVLIVEGTVITVVTNYPLKKGLK